METAIRNLFEALAKLGSPVFPLFLFYKTTIAAITPGQTNKSIGLILIIIGIQHYWQQHPTVE